MQLFLSYSRKDAAFALGLARSLEALGHSVWIDTEDIVASGEDLWRRSIVNGIVGCDVLLLVLSPNSVTSQNVEREITVAAEEKKRIVPVVFRPCEIPPGFLYELAGVQRIDFSTQPPDEAVAQLDRFLRQLGPQAGAAVVPPASPLAPPMLPVPAAPDPRIDHRRRNVAIGAGTGIVLVIALIAALTSGGGDGSTNPTSPGVVTESGVAGTTTPVAAPTDATPITVIDPVAQQAMDIVSQWAAATSARDWDTVRAISVPEQGKDLARFNTFYGAPNDPRHMQTVNAYIAGANVQTGNVVHVEGAVVAWDVYFDDSRVVGDPPLSTNTGCREWVVDVGTGKILEWSVPHDPGLSGGERVYEQIQEADFPRLYADYCHAAA